MKPTRAPLGINRRALLTATAALPILFAPGLPVLQPAQAQTDALPSWNDGANKQAITGFVARITQQGGPDFVPPAGRIATFDNDGTLWVEHPMYTQLAFVLDRVKAMAPMHPEWTAKQPRGSRPPARMAELVMATHAGMTTDEFQNIVTDWLATARDRGSSALYRALISAMIELLAICAQRVQDSSLGRRRRVLRVASGLRLRGVRLDQQRATTSRSRSRSASMNLSAAARSRPSATPTATCKCCNGRPWPAVRALG